MPGLRRDQMFQLAPVGFVGLAQDDRCLHLRVLFTAVAQHGDVEQVAHIVRRIVHAPQRRFVEGHVFDFHVLVTPGLGESGTGVHHRPMICVMRAQVLGAGATHREAHQRDALGIDLVVGLDVGDGLQHVDLPGALEADALAAEGLQHDGIAGSVFACVARATAEEVQIGVVLAAPVQADVERRRFGEVEAVGDDQAIGQHCAVDRRDVAAHHQPMGSGPRCGLQLLQPFGGLLDRPVGLGHVLGGIPEFVEAQSELHRLDEDRHVGGRLGAAGLGQSCAQFLRRGLKTCAVGLRDGLAGRRQQAPDGGRLAGNEPGRESSGQEGEQQGADHRRTLDGAGGVASSGWPGFLSANARSNRSFATSCQQRRRGMPEFHPPQSLDGEGVFLSGCLPPQDVPGKPTQTRPE